MKYNFNDIASAVASGASIDDICAAFTQQVNDYIAKSKEEKEKYERILNQACEDLSLCWEEAIYAYKDAGMWPADSTLEPDDLLISQETFRNLIDALVKNYEVIELLEAIAKEINSQINICSQDEKIVANPLKSKSADKDDFDAVMHDFFKKAHIE